MVTCRVARATARAAVAAGWILLGIVVVASPPRQGFAQDYFPPAAQPSGLPQGASSAEQPSGGQARPGGAAAGPAAGEGSGDRSGMPRRGGTGEQERGGPGGKSGGGTREGYIIPDEDLTALYESIDRRPVGDKVPATHVVQAGDTLWDLCSYYFGNPWFWPKLWSYNPAITNPHWIFPGDVVKLKIEEDGETGDEAAKLRMTTTGRRLQIGPADFVVLRQTGFIEQRELDLAAEIVGSREEKIMLATHDQVYLGTKPTQPLHVGGVYSVFRVQREVKHPRTRKRVGYLVEILGDIEVLEQTPQRVARGQIIDASQPMERGYRVGPLRRQFKLIEAKQNAVAVEGCVLLSQRPASLIGAEQIVFLDVGRSSGIQIGNRFVVTRRGDGYQPVGRPPRWDDKRYPVEEVAEILVVDLMDKTSVGWVTRSAREVEVGDVVEMRIGY